jgi:hypothetical protein
MPEPVKRIRLRRWGAKVCALPFVVALFLVVTYLGFGMVTQGWKVKGDKSQEVYDLKCLPDDNDRDNVCLLNGSATLRNTFDEKLKIYGTVDDWRRAITAPGLVMWRTMTALALIAALCALLVAGYVIWRAPRRPKEAGWRLGIAVLLLAICAAAFQVMDKALARGGQTMSVNATFIVRQFLAQIDSQLVGGRVIYYEMLLLSIGYVTAFYLLCASGATLLPYNLRSADEKPSLTKEEVEDRAKYLAMQTRNLRLILYVGALLLALTALRGKTNFDWALEYLPPLWALPEKSAELQAATAFYAKLRSLALNNITATGVMNTLLLAAVYVPAALVLQSRAGELADEAMSLESTKATDEGQSEAQVQPGKEEEERKGDKREEKPRGEKPPDREEWLKAHGLAFPLKEQLTRIAALISPLLAGPIAELLSLLKG